MMEGDAIENLMVTQPLKTMPSNRIIKTSIGIYKSGCVKYKAEFYTEECYPVWEVFVCSQSL